MGQSNRFQPSTPGVLLVVAGIVAGIWPMTVHMLGMPVASGPPPLILFSILRNKSEIVGSASTAEEDVLGLSKITDRVVEAVLTEAALRTAVAVFLLCLGICFLLLSGKRKPRVQAYRVTGPGVPQTPAS